MDILTYAWSFVSVPAASAITEADLDLTDAAMPAFNPDVLGDYVLELTVSDSQLSDTARVLVNADQGPVVVEDSLAATPNPAPLTTGGAYTDVTITASIDETGTGGSAVGAAQYRIDGEVDGNGDPVWYVMDPVDGVWDEDVEEVTAMFNLADFGIVEAGIHTISVTGTDAATQFRPGYTGPETTIMLVVYDPSAGFVTGGGWITSPLGAYAPDAALTGKAKFGFVAKYKKGAMTPVGNTEFQFKAGGLSFHSSDYDWLVVAGSKAMFKGTGTVNGEGVYKFMLSAGDGDLRGGSGVDTFRIRIWEEDVNGVETTLYDNQMGDGVDADASTELGGGSIIIHSK